MKADSTTCRNNGKYYEYHEDMGHMIRECWTLDKAIDQALERQEMNSFSPPPKAADQIIIHWSTTKGSITTMTMKETQYSSSWEETEEETKKKMKRTHFDRTLTLSKKYTWKV